MGWWQGMLDGSNRHALPFERSDRSLEHSRFGCIDLFIHSIIHSFNHSFGKNNPTTILRLVRHRTLFPFSFLDHYLVLLVLHRVLPSGLQQRTTSNRGNLAPFSLNSSRLVSFHLVVTADWFRAGPDCLTTAFQTPCASSSSYPRRSCFAKPKPRLSGSGKGIHFIA
mmetsp:Transcript_22282/g.52676  ORF Transcript_22282/g.52676 Transcript_22282/m.52676 type:complete len:167 (-) Transcript_22282:198-698(-)